MVQLPDMWWSFGKFAKTNVFSLQADHDNNAMY